MSAVISVEHPLGLPQHQRLGPVRCRSNHVIKLVPSGPLPLRRDRSFPVSALSEKTKWRDSPTCLPGKRRTLVQHCGTPTFLGRGPRRRALAHAASSEGERGDAAVQGRMEGSALDAGMMPVKPSPLLTAQEAVEAQLEALRGVYHPNGDLPVPHSGLEVLYNFASIDPFNKGSSYFGRTLNVAYFSQFSAKFSLREFKPLLGMRSYQIVSMLHISQTRFLCRVLVHGFQHTPYAFFVFTLVKKEQGHLKGCWVTESLHRVEGGL